MIEYAWNPNLHPRDRTGRFREALWGPGMLGASPSHLPSTSAEDVDARFGWPEFQEFESSLAPLAAKHNLTEHHRRAVGFWQDEMEPSSVITWDGREADALAYAGEIGRLFDQDAVAYFSFDPSAGGSRYLIPFQNRAEAIARLRDLGYDGAAFMDNAVVLYDMDSSDTERAFKLAHYLGSHVDVARGHVRFLSKGVDYEHAQEDDAADHRGGEGLRSHRDGDGQELGRRDHSAAWDQVEVAFAWDPGKHPRNPRGREGGRFRRIAPWRGITLAKSEFPEDEASMETMTEAERAKVTSTWERQTGMPAARVRTNLGDVLGVADADSIAAGKVWYSDANKWARERGRTHDVDFETVAGMLSALSPMTEWGANQHQADLTLQYYSTDPEGFRAKLPQQAAFDTIEWAKARGEKWPLGAGRRNVVNAARILQGEPPGDVLNQAKTRSFFNSIAEPDNPFDVVIDTHMINAAFGGLTPGAEGVLVEVGKPASAKFWGDVVTPEGADFTARKPFSWFGSPKVRGRDVGVTPLLSDAIRDVTDDWNATHPDDQLSPMQIQAIIWTQWLKMHPAQEKRAAVKASQRATVAAAQAALA